MLTKFAVRNFKGFSKRIEWVLDKPNNYEFNPQFIKDGIIKNGIVYGPNGSGKTNLGIAIFDIVRHLTQKYIDPTKYDPRYFLTAGSIKTVADFEYHFSFNGKEAVYKYSKNNNNQLISESLKYDKHLLFSKDGADLFIDEDIYPINDAAKKNLIGNANMVSIVGYLLNVCPVAEDDCLFQLRKFVESMLWYRCLEEKSFIGLEFIPDSIDAFITDNDLTEDFAEFLDKASGQKYEFVKGPQADKVLKCIINGAVVPFYPIASTGTHSLHLLYYWLQKISKASFVFVDEFDAFYHHSLSIEVCRRLFKNDCQVFLSTHNTALMNNDILRPDCYFILDNNMIKPLNDCTSKDIRFGHNLEKLYRGGALEISAK